MLRDYSLATLDAAKAAAYYPGIIYTDAPPHGGSDAVELLDPIELDRNTLLTMPGGWKMSQLRAEQPTGTYAEFKREVLNEISRSINVPFNVAAGNSSSYNYASGRLDHQTYFKSIRIDQSRMERNVLDRILAAWFRFVPLRRSRDAASPILAKGVVIGVGMARDGYCNPPIARGTANAGHRRRRDRPMKWRGPAAGRLPRQRPPARRPPPIAVICPMSGKHGSLAPASAPSMN